MPPKKGGNVNKKTEVKKKEKIIEDKTFGLKNKKGGKAQKVSFFFSYKCSSNIFNNLVH